MLIYISYYVNICLLTYATFFHNILLGGVKMNERIKKLRKELGLNQEKFGERLGITKTAVSKMELGTYNTTETMIRLICNEFHANEEWLRTGEGDIFLEQSIDEEFAEIIAEAALSGNEKIKELMVMASKLNDKQLKAMVDFLETMVGEK